MWMNATYQPMQQNIKQRSPRWFPPLPISKQVWKDIVMNFMMDLPFLVVVNGLSNYAHFSGPPRPYTAKAAVKIFVKRCFQTAFHAMIYCLWLWPDLKDSDVFFLVFFFLLNECDGLLKELKNNINNAQNQIRFQHNHYRTECVFHISYNVYQMLGPYR